MVFVSKVMIIVMTFLSDTETILFKNNLTNKDNTVLLEKLFLELGKRYSVCFWANQLSNELSTNIFKQSFRNNIAVTTETSSSDFTRSCDTFAFINFSSLSVCSLFLNSGVVYLSLDYKIIIMNISVNYNFEELENCASRFESANVTVLTLQSETFVLSSPLFFPRRFTPSNNLTSHMSPMFNKLDGKLINVATFHYPPFVEVTQEESSVEYSGLEMNLWQAVSSYLNFTWRVIALDKGLEWGVTLKNGSLVGGITQALEEGAADVSFCNIWQRSLYVKSMDFGPLMNKISLTFLVRRPQEISDHFQNLFGVFRAEVWLTTLTALVGISLVHWCACSLGASVSSNKTSLAESLLVMFGILTVSSSHVRSPTSLARAMVTCWFVFTLLLTTAITSTIVTRLTLPLYAPRVDSFKQLVEGNYYWTHSNYQGLVQKHKEFYFNLNNSWQMQFEARYRMIEPSELQELIRSDDKLVLPAQRWGSEYVVMNLDGVNASTDLQSFRAMRTSTRDAFTSFGLRKRSPYNELFTRTIQSFVDRGLWSYLRRHADKANVRKDLLVEKDVSGGSFKHNEPLTLQKMYPVFLLLISGNIFVCIVFVIEFVYRD